jgi:hypothetical protein
MIRVVTLVSVLTVLVCGITTDATAQLYIRPSRVTSAKEVAVLASGSSVLDLTAFGGRVTVNRSDWLGTEASLEASKATAVGPAQRMLIVNARLMTPADDTRDTFWMLTAGGAVGTGLRQTMSPMIGVGVLKPSEDGTFAARVDFQYFPGGLMRARSNWRTTVGVAVVLH